MKPTKNILFIGNTDAGKSSICGHILSLMGRADLKADQSQGEACWRNLLDTTSEERERGITIDVGQNFFETDKYAYTILDAPGHRILVPNMINGCNQADIAILIVSARKGEMEAGMCSQGQTREHALLARMFGIRNLVLVINKMDVCNWDRDRFEEVVKPVMIFLTTECGWNSKDIIGPIPISGYQGDNLKVAVSSEVCSWYNGPSLLQVLDNIPQKENVGTITCFLISQIAKELGVNYYVGKLESGKLAVGCICRTVPSGTVSIKKILSPADHSEISSIEAGQYAILNLTENIDLPTGSIFCDEIPEFIRYTDEFQAQLVLTDVPNGLLTAGFTSVVHLGFNVKTGVIEKLHTVLDRKTRKVLQKNPVFAKTGSIVIATIKLSDKVILADGVKMPPLGRFVLRVSDRTVAFGKVV